MENILQITKTIFRRKNKFRNNTPSSLDIPASSRNESIISSNSHPVLSELHISNEPSSSTDYCLSSSLPDISSNGRNQEIIPSKNLNADSMYDLSSNAKISSSNVSELTNNKPEHYNKDWSISDLAISCAGFEEIPLELRDDMLASASQEALLSYPEFFYDFCLVSSDEDYSKATILKEELCAKFNLTGCMLYDDDFFSLGRDLFEAYESMMERSTKIFFYISDNFNINNFCKRLQSGAVFQCLMSRVRKEKEKCVPVFPNGICKVPLPLSGIGGLEIPNTNMTKQRLQITYTDDVRQQRLKLERENNVKRKTFFVDCLSLKVKQYSEDCRKPVLENGESEPLKYSCKNSPSNSQQKSTNFSPTKVLNDMAQVLENSTSSPVVSSSDVNITAGSAHIGHNITINVHYTGEAPMEYSSDTDSSDS